MANLPDITLTLVFNLQRQLFRVIHEATATEYWLAEGQAETASLLLEFEELQNIRERARDSYNRFSRLLLTIGSAQPVASSSTLNLLYGSIEQAEATIAALNASIQDIKRNWNLS